MLRTILAALVTVSAVPAQAAVERTVAAMGTWLDLRVSAADRASALSASEAAVQAVAAVEARLSTWRPDSEVSLANQAPPRTPFALSPATADDVRMALRFASASEGTFTPGLGALIDAYGLRGARRWPGPTELAAARGQSAASAIALDGESLVRSSPTAWLSTDAIAKGIALRHAAAAVRAAGATARLDFGGQWLVEGGSTEWIAVAHPDHRDQVVATIALLPGRSAATSGNGERRAIVDGRPHGHLLDPRTGTFADDFGSVTAVATDPALADAAATALFVAGPAAGPALAARLGVEALFVVRVTDATVRCVATPGLGMRPTSPHP